MNKSKFFKRAALSLAVSSMLVSMQVSAADPVISNIQIRGLNRVSKGAVLLALPVKEGDVMTKQNTALSLQRLYATGDFDDVKISQNGDTIIVDVKERPTIGAIDFSGNTNIKDEDLTADNIIPPALDRNVAAVIAEAVAKAAKASGVARI